MENQDSEVVSEGVRKGWLVPIWSKTAGKILYVSPSQLAELNTGEYSPLAPTGKAQRPAGKARK